jgi:hypothetical protein
MNGRRRRSVWSYVAASAVTSVVALSACSSDSDGASASVVTSAAPATDADTATSGATDDTTAPVGPDIDPDCLQGLWNLDLGELTRLLQATYPIPELQVPLGSASLEFVGGQAIFLGQFRLEFDVGTEVLQTDADFRRIGDVKISGPNIDLVFTTAEGGIDPFVELNADGSTSEAPIAPTLDPPDLPGAGVVCTADTLSFPESSTGVPGPFVFTRAPA